MNSSRQVENTEKFQLLLEILYEKINLLSKEQDVEAPDEMGLALLVDQPILKLDLEAKSHKSSLLSSWSKVIHVNGHHPLLSMLVINKFSCSNKEFKPNLPKVEVTLVFKKIKHQAESEKYFIRDAGLAKLLIELCDLALMLDLVEYKILKCGLVSVEKETGIVPIQDWSGAWDAAGVKDSQFPYYHEINDPKIIHKFNTQVLLKVKLKETEPLIVLDVGGGKGRLAFKLISEALQKNIFIHYIFVEPNLHQLRAAKALLNNHFNEEKLKLTFLPSTLEDLLLNDKAHCIISSGGPLNLQVVSRSSALKNIEIIKNLLLPGGIFIGTGFTAFLVNSKHFKNAGMTPLSYTMAMSEEEKRSLKLKYKKKHHFFQCYVAKNPKEEVMLEGPKRNLK